MGKIGCAAAVVLLGMLGLEVWVYLLVSRLVVHDYFVPLVVIGVMSIIGVAMIRRTIAQIPMALLGGGGGRLMVRMMAGALLVFPGLLTDALGLLLLLPGVNRLFSTLGNKILAAVIKRSMAAMMKGGAGGAGGGFAAFGQLGGFPGAKGGGFPGFPGFPAPGGQAPRLSPDDQASFPPKGRIPGKPPKTYDTTAEKE